MPNTICATTLAQAYPVVVPGSRDLMPHARFACSMRLHHGRHGHAIGRNASYLTSTSETIAVHYARGAKPSRRRMRTAAPRLSECHRAARSPPAKTRRSGRHIHSESIFECISEPKKGCATNGQIKGCERKHPCDKRIRSIFVAQQTPQSHGEIMTTHVHRENIRQEQARHLNRATGLDGAPKQ